jgi:hypothetical protein
MLARFLLVALVMLAACGSDPSPGDTAPAPTSPTSTRPVSTTGPPTPPTTTAPTPSSFNTTVTTTPANAPTTTTIMQPAVDDLAAATEAFQTWVGYLGEGDHEAAWEAMAPSSQAAVGEELFFDSMVYEMSEGWGSWSAGRDLEFRLEQDENGRTLLWVSGTISPEGMTEHREVAVPMVESDGGYLVSPFEEFGNVAEAVEEKLAGSAAPPVPADSGSGRRVVYSNSDQRVWLVDGDGTLVDSYLVSGRRGVPQPGTYEVYSRSKIAYAGHDDITMRFMVRFAHGENLPIGFHAIPNDGSGAPLQSEEQLGEYRSAGCVRQTLVHANFLYEWATEGTPVVVLA